MVQPQTLPTGGWILQKAQTHRLEHYTLEHLNSGCTVQNNLFVYLLCRTVILTPSKANNQMVTGGGYKWLQRFTEQ